MTRHFLAGMIALSSCSFTAFAQEHLPAAPALRASMAVNQMCPIGKEPIDTRYTIKYDGHTVGFCCPGCDEAFLDWEKDRRDAFIAANTGQPARETAKESAKQPEKDAPKKETPKEASPAKPERPTIWSVYPLSTCPISGKALGSMGDPVIKTYEGRQVRFCCAGCVPTFEADTAKHLKKVDEQIIASQLPYYPLTTCPISGGKLGSMGEPDNFVYQNRLVRFCCDSCRGSFLKDPATHMAAIDKAAADEQRASYPLKTCPVTGKNLGSMGEPAEVILAGRLIRLCCPPCERQLRADPVAYLAEIDDAWRKAGRKGLEPKR
jgi:YHS domain-containing protein